MAEDEAREGQAERISATPADDDPKLEQDFARAPGLSRGERKVVQRLADVLRFNDFMTVMMVIATALSAFATWRTAHVTNLLFTIAERPYIGVDRVAVDSVDAEFARVVIECRNFGQVSATGGVARVSVFIDGKLLLKAIGGAAIENVGIVSPTVPHPVFRFVPISLFNAVREGHSRMIVRVAFDYRGPDQRQFCYRESMTYDRRLASFVPSGGSDQCGAEIY
jgi:hypothetical protein